MLVNLVGRYRASGITLVFSGLKKQVHDVMARTGLLETIGAGNVFPTDREALDTLYQRLDQPNPRDG